MLLGLWIGSELNDYTETLVKMPVVLGAYFKTRARGLRCRALGEENKGVLVRIHSVCLNGSLEPGPWMVLTTLRGGRSSPYPLTHMKLSWAHCPRHPWGVLSVQSKVRPPGLPFVGGQGPVPTKARRMIHEINFICIHVIYKTFS